jgi:hypothetical protein
MQFPKSAPITMPTVAPPGVWPKSFLPQIVFYRR